MKTGDTVGPYRILGRLGEGGMGEVYRAHDTRLNRNVAIKVLPEIFASDLERLARFRREAQLLASLNHPNIAAIYGLEESDRTTALVLELVDGPTLAERLTQGAVPIDESLSIGRQIVDALEAAHERGVIHRDLKPANIKLTVDGKVKVLDFGLAKLLDANAAASGHAESGLGLTNSPTFATPATTAGLILGTAAYMSPEQAKGRPVDKRSDIWAFGCVLFEMLTGTAAFGGETVTEIIAGVIHKEPAWETLSRGVPPHVQQLLRRCLTKDAARRLRDIGDARLELEQSVSPDAQQEHARPAARPRVVWQWSVIAFIAGAVIASGIAAMMFGTPAAPAALTRWNMSLPADAPISLRGPWGSLSVSRDGRTIAYVSDTATGRQLVVRRADDLTPRVLNGTTEVWEAFFAPDGQWIGFIAADRLKKVAITGGQPATIADVPNFDSGVWADDGTIYIGGRAGLAKVSPDGQLTQLVKPADDEGALTGPDLLPDGSLLFTIEPNNVTSFDDARIGVLTPAGERRVILEGGAYARYAPTGHVVYARGGQIMAATFDVRRLTVGEPVPVVAGGSFDIASGSAYFALSRSGVLVYVPGGPLVKQRSLVWIDRRGVVTPLPVPHRFYAEPSISLDGRQIAVTMRAANDDVWTYDIARNALTRLTFPRGNNQVPIWTRDGRRIVYGLDRHGVRRLVWRSADGSDEEQPLTPAEYFQTPGSLSPDGKLLVYTQDRPETGSDLFILPFEGNRQPVRFLATPVNERWAVFSPDGRWIAYTSDETGQFEVFVVPYPGPGRRWQVSQGGGVRPAWRSDGREIVYYNVDRLMAVGVRGGSLFQAEPPRELVKLPPFTDYFAMAPDGSRFLVVAGDGEDRTARELNVVLNWMEELKQRVHVR
jgi:Tol biopolymer transport system component